MQVSNRLGLRPVMRRRWPSVLVTWVRAPRVAWFITYVTLWTLACAIAPSFSDHASSLPALVVAAIAGVCCHEWMRK